MAPLDQGFRAMATALLNGLGAQATLVRRTVQYDESIDREVGETEAEYAVRISPPAPFKQHSLARESGSNGTVVLTGDMQCVLAAKGLAGRPDKSTDHLMFRGNRWRIVEVWEIQGDQDIAFRLHLRK